MNYCFDWIRMLSKEPEKRLTALELLNEFSQVDFDENQLIKERIFLSCI